MIAQVPFPASQTPAELSEQDRPPEPPTSRTNANSPLLDASAEMPATHGLGGLHERANDPMDDGKPFRGQCEGRSRQMNRRCRRYCVRGRRFCKFHGGNSKVGMAHPNFQGKGFSKALPLRLEEAYQAAVRNPELLSLRKDIALTVARIDELVGRLTNPERRPAWADLVRTLSALEIAHRTGISLDAHLAEMKRIIGAGVAADTTWNELMRAGQVKARLVARESRRLKELGEFITPEQFRAWQTAVALAVKRHVGDRDLLKRIADDLREFRARSGAA